MTGHTGFKGAWLTLLLAEAGHEVHGLALDPIRGAVYEVADLGPLLASDLRVDVRDHRQLQGAVSHVKPEIVVHLAAQPLVRTSYKEPVPTVLTNVVGTMNLLEATRHVDTVRAQLIVTTDKVYRNIGPSRGYVEADPLGGEDPYSASKAMADLLTQSWLASLDCPPTAVARAGNVIGGGDVSPDRLMPDLISGFIQGSVVPIRYPAAVRPWQHVLDCLAGYQILIRHVLERGIQGVWNFGPSPEHSRTVAELADTAAAQWGPGASWVASGSLEPPEAHWLTLDSSRARRELMWSDRLGFSEAVSWTTEWAKRHISGESARTIAVDQIQRFQALA